MEQTPLITVPHIMDAHEINKLTKESIKKINEQQLNNLCDRIQSRAIDGYFNLTIWNPLSSENEKFLRLNGFKIWKEPSTCCTYKGKPATLTTISWEFIEEEGKND